MIASDTSVCTVRTECRWWWCPCWFCCTEIEHWMGESVSGPWTGVFDLCIIDEIEQGVFMFLRLFIDVSVTLLEKMYVQFFQ
jgi:hypothetical protein